VRAVERRLARPRRQRRIVDGVEDRGGDLLTELVGQRPLVVPLVAAGLRGPGGRRAGDLIAEQELHQLGAASPSNNTAPAPVVATGAVRIADSSLAIARTAFSMSASGGSPAGVSAVKGTKLFSFIPSGACVSATTSMRTVRWLSSTTLPSLEQKRRRTMAKVAATREEAMSGKSASTEESLRAVARSASGSAAPAGKGTSRCATASLEKSPTAVSSSAAACPSAAARLRASVSSADLYASSVRNQSSRRSAA